MQPYSGTTGAVNRTLQGQDNRYRSSSTAGAQSPQTASSEDFTAQRQETRSTLDSSTQMQRLNQVIQNFHTKAALIILHSRTELSAAYSRQTNEKRVNKWFNIELDETDDYIDAIRPWKKIDILSGRPSPLCIEIYLTTDTLPQGQRLVITDDDQKRWDVYDAFEPEDSSRRGRQRPVEAREILLERWTIQLGSNAQPIPKDLTHLLPHVYKKSILLFRALFTYCNFLPVWRLIRKMGKSRSTMGMKIGYRIVSEDKLDGIARADNLGTPLFDSKDDVTGDYSFGSTESPAGPFSVNVKYRSNCDFRIDDSEELLSSHFLGMNDDVSEPVASRRHIEQDINPSKTHKAGSLPTDQRRQLLEKQELGQAYGSLATYHHAGVAAGTSPLSALRAVGDMVQNSPGSQHGQPEQAQSTAHTQDTPSQIAASVPTRPSITGRASTTGRKSSFSIQPFKTATLSASPQSSSSLGASPRISSRAIPTLGSLKEESVPAGPNAPAVAARRPPSIASIEQIETTTSGSPRSRFTSAFAHRRNRLSVDRGIPTTSEEGGSSGKQSAISSAQPGSGLMAETQKSGKSGHSGSSISEHLEADADSIHDFLNLLESNKGLLDTNPIGPTLAAAQRTSQALDRFHKMKGGNAQLSESMSSSLMLASKSPASNLRQPPTQTRVSTSISPGTVAKPTSSPHTPHMPFAPSRLSAAYSHDDFNPEEIEDNDDGVLPAEGTKDEPSTTDHAIDIPVAEHPRRQNPNYQMPSSYRHTSQQEQQPDFTRRASSLGTNKQDISDLTAHLANLKLPSGPTADMIDAALDMTTAPAVQAPEVAVPITTAGVDGTHESEYGSARSYFPTTYRSRHQRGGSGGSGRGSYIRSSPAQGSFSSIGGTGASAEKVNESGGSASGSLIRSAGMRGVMGVGAVGGMRKKPGVERQISEGLEEESDGDDDGFLPFAMETSSLKGIHGTGKSEEMESGYGRGS